MNKKISKITASIILASMLAYTLPVAAFTKDETVYSNLKSNGEEYKTIVTTHLENEEDETILKDLTNLLKIENTSGDEKFTQNGESLIWEANSNDIYYKGETEKELPIKISVKYELDGNELSANEIKGKSGKIKVIIEYKNKYEHDVLVDGKQEKMYTPFVVACGTYINNENNKHIETTNGKVIDDGSKTMVIGLVFPGMQESLKISKEKFEIPEKIEITMESTNFEMSNIINYITPRLIEENDLEIFEDLNSIYSQVNTLKSASQTIENGAKTLEEGTNEYSEKSAEFNKAINDFTNGINKAHANYTEINSGIEELNSKSNQLQSGSKQLSEGLSAVENGVNQMKAGLTSSAENMQTLINGTTTLANGLEALKQNLATTTSTNEIKTKINSTSAAITELVTKKAELEKAKTTLSKINTTDDAEKNEVIQILANQINTYDTTIKTLQVEYQTLTATLDAIIEQSNSKMKTITQTVTALSDGANQVNSGIQKLTGSMTTLTAGLETLSTSSNALSKGASTLYNGTKQLSAGTNKLKAGSNQMQAGLYTLNESSNAIVNADNQLTQGAQVINEGAKQLSSGIQEFNKTGIEPICTFINNELKSITTRAEKLQELSKEYNTFTKIDEENKGKVKFITIIDSIKNDDKNNSKEKTEEKTSK